MIVFKHKRGGEFKLTSRREFDGDPVDLTGWVLTSQLRKLNGELVEDLEVTMVDAAQGEYTIAATTDTRAWPVDELRIDVVEEDPDGKVKRSQPIKVLVLKDQTLELEEPEPEPELSEAYPYDLSYTTLRRDFITGESETMGAVIEDLGWYTMVRDVYFPANLAGSSYHIEKMGPNAAMEFEFKDMFGMTSAAIYVQGDGYVEYWAIGSEEWVVPAGQTLYAEAHIFEPWGEVEGPLGVGILGYIGDHGPVPAYVSEPPRVQDEPLEDLEEDDPDPDPEPDPEPTGTFIDFHESTQRWHGDRAIRLDGAPSSGDILAAWDGIGQHSDMEVVALASMTRDYATNNRARIVLRASGGHITQNGYAVEASSFNYGTFALIKLVDGLFTNITPGGGSNVETPFKPGPSMRIWFRLRAEGDQIKAKVWLRDHPEPTGWTFEVTDTDLTSGFAGFAARGGNEHLDVMGVGVNGATAPMTADEATGSDQYFTDFSGASEGLGLPADWQAIWSTSTAWMVDGYYPYAPPLDFGQLYDPESRTTINPQNPDLVQLLNRFDSRFTALAATGWGRHADVDVRSQMASLSTTGYQAGLCVRAGGIAEDPSGYAVFFNGGDEISLMRWTGPTSGVTLATDSFAWAAGSFFRVRFQAIGDQLKVKVWSGGENDEPSEWNIEVTDSTHMDPGFVGLCKFTGSNNAAWVFLDLEVLD